MNPTQINAGPVGHSGAISMDELYRQYGEACVQFKLVQGKVMMLEQQIQQIMNQVPPPQK